MLFYTIFTQSNVYMNHWSEVLASHISLAPSFGIFGRSNRLSISNNFYRLTVVQNIFKQNYLYLIKRAEHINVLNSVFNFFIWSI